MLLSQGCVFDLLKKSLLMKFGIITFPGLNCDLDMIYLLRNQLQVETVELWHKDHALLQRESFLVATRRCKQLKGLEQSKPQMLHVKF
jgi:hypothetical protein